MVGGNYFLLLFLVVPILAITISDTPIVKVRVLLNQAIPCKGCSSIAKAAVVVPTKQSRAASIRKKAIQLRKMQEDIRRNAQQTEKDIILDNLEENWAEEDKKIRKAETQMISSNLLTVDKEKQALEKWKKQERDEKDQKLASLSLNQDIGDKLRKISKSLEVNISAQLKLLKKFDQVEVDATEAMVRARREELQKNETANEISRSLNEALKVPRTEAQACLNASKVFRSSMPSCNKTLSCLEALRATFKAVCVPYAIKKKARNDALAEKRRIATQKPPTTKATAPPIAWQDKKAALLDMVRKTRAMTKLMKLSWKRLSDMPPPPAAPALPGQNLPAAQPAKPLPGLSDAQRFMASATRQVMQILSHCKKLWAMQQNVTRSESK